jgi:hypothetical protein
MYKNLIKAMSVLALTGVTSVQAADNVFLTESNPILAGAGGTLSLNIAGNFNTPTDGGGFTFSWDPGVLTYTGLTIADTTIGGPWDTFSSFDASSAASGTVDNIFVIADAAPGASGAFDIATVNFNVVGALGSSTDITIADVFGGWSATGTSLPITVDYTAGQVNVVPLPAAAWLMLSSLGVLGAVRRRKRDQLEAGDEG